MMIGPKRFLAAAVAAAALFLAPAGAAADKLRVVASFSILADMVRNVGGDRIDLKSLVGPDGDTHVYQPSPDDAKAVARANVVVINGLEFEGWIERLIESAGFTGPVVVASRGVEVIAADEDHDDDHGKKDEHGHDEHGKKDEHGHHHHGEFDPHAWHSLHAATVYVRNIADALIAADAANADAYRANAAAYTGKIEALEAEFHTRLDALPKQRRSVVTAHDAFGYFTRDYGIKFHAAIGLSTEAEPSAKDVAKLIRQIRKERIAAAFMENITDSRLVEQIAQETGVAIGGTLYPGALSGPDGPAPTYLEMMRHNLLAITRALGG